MSENFWTVFHDTGDPICYLLCKAEERQTTSDMEAGTDFALDSLFNAEISP